MNSNYLDRAKYSYGKIDEYKKNSANSQKTKDEQSRLKSYAKKVPQYIQTNGLLATIAFVDNKKDGSDNVDKKAYQCLYNIIDEWCKNNVFKNCDSITMSSEALRKANLIEILVNLSVEDYKYTEQEIMNLFVWVRRFAEGELKD